MGILELVTGLLLIVLPIAFNVAFALLVRAFDYPEILRLPPDTILRRFHAGGTGLVLRWWAFAVIALAMFPIAVLVGFVLRGAPDALVAVGIVVGVLASLVQLLGLIRWPFLVPELARRYVEADGPGVDATRQSIEVAFVAFHRLLGVAIGEHLGYLLTGLWTILVGIAIVASSTLPALLGWAAVPIGVALLVGALEFVGPNERAGWSPAGRLVPIAYVAWSLWLITFGLALLT